MEEPEYVPKFLSRQEAAEVLGVDLAVVDRLVSTGALDRYRIRERYVRVLTGQVVALADLPREWLARC
ncbi:helix-turn-helix DNA-binding protein [Streptomyces phage Xkcd426]|nr:helix-turn-helix DNA-binding protein [Streptomyces phage Xkcd426]